MGGDPAEDSDPRLAHRRRGHRQQRGIYQIARDLAQLGMAVLMICDEIPEAYYNSHRVMVMRKGELIAEFAPHQSTEQQIAEVVNG